MSKTKRPIMPAEALEILASALAYCQQAGMKIQTLNSPTTSNLMLVLPGVAVDVTPSGASFRLVEHSVTPPEIDVTSPPNAVTPPEGGVGEPAGVDVTSTPA